MTALIKRENSAGREVAAIAWRGEIAELQDAPAKNPAVAALELEVASLRQAIETANAEHAEALVEARRAAQVEVKAQHKRDDERNFAAIEAGVEKARDDFSAKLGELDLVAILVAESALGGVFDAGPKHEEIKDIILRQLAEIRRDSVLEIAVSADDFTDDAARTELEGRLDGFAVTIDPRLSAGECRIGLRLGEIEISLGEHWAKVRDHFALALERSP